MRFALFVFFTVGTALAQGPSASDEAGQPNSARPTRPALERTLQLGLPGRWWRNARIAQRLNLTRDQQQKMDDVFQQNRLKLIDLAASLDKEEALLEPLVEAEQPDAAKIHSQIDRIAQARSDLEKANANMLLGIRLILTQDQWRRLQTNSAGPQPRQLDDKSVGPSPRSSPVPKKIQ